MSYSQNDILSCSRHFCYIEGGDRVRRKLKGQNSLEFLVKKYSQARREGIGTK